MINIKLIKKKINRKIFILRSKKIALALRKVLKKPIIGIVDIGAGHRYLPILLNFDLHCLNNQLKRLLLEL